MSPVKEKKNMKKDVTKKRCLSDNERYADLINGVVFKGKQKVRKEKGINKAEFLSGFKRESRLYPCITLVLFFGETWDGSKDLHGILDFTDIPEEMKEYVNNYQMHLLEIRKLENTEVFQPDLKQIFDFIRYAKDKEKLKELVENDPVYKEMDEDAYDMAVEYTNAKELIAVKGYYGKDGKVDMCEALTALIEDGWKEGIKEGIKEGLDEKTRQIVRNMLERGMADKDIIALAECRQELIEEVRKGL